MIRQKTVAMVLAAGLAVTGLAACGTATTASTTRSVPAALRATTNQSAVQLTLTLEGDPSAVPGGHLTTAQQQAILASSLVLVVRAANGTTVAHPGPGGELALSLVKSGSRLAELRVVGSALYGRVDLAQIGSAYHLDQGTVARFRSMLQRYSSKVTALNALANGQWVSLDLGAVQSFAQAGGIRLPSIPQVAAGLLNALFDSLAGGTASTSAGQSQVAVNVRQLVASLTQTLAAIPGLSKLSPQIGGLSQKAQNAVPAAKSAIVGVTVKGGTVSNLELSLNQFDTDHHLKGPVSINVAVAPGGAVSAPSGAVAVDLGQLVQVIGGSIGH